MIQVFFIPGRLPGANECLWKHWRVFSRLKKKYQSMISQAIRQAGLKPMGKVRMSFLWQEKNRKRDLGNIAFGEKFISDSLVHEKILKGDGQKYVIGLTHNILIHPEQTGVWVTLDGD